MTSQIELRHKCNSIEEAKILKKFLQAYSYTKIYIIKTEIIG